MFSHWGDGRHPGVGGPRHTQIHPKYSCHGTGKGYPQAKFCFCDLRLSRKEINYKINDKIIHYRS